MTDVPTPGEYLRDELLEREWTPTDFAKKVNWPIETVHQILNGYEGFTPSMADSIGEVLGTSGEVWRRLQERSEKAKNE